MNNKIFPLKIPLGYEIVQRTKIVDLYTAYEILRSKKQRHITTARRTGYKAELITHYIKCPHCRNKVYAYAHYHNKNAVAYSKKSKATIFEWSDVQPSLESEPNVELQIQEFEDFSGEYICPKCGYSSNKSNEYTELYIDYVYGKLLVKKSIKNLSELISLKWLRGTTAIDFPLYEQFVFDFESGKTYVQILNENNIICAEAFTDSETDFSSDILIDLFSKNNMVKRKVRSFLEEITGYKMPFTTNELDINKFVNFVRFSGFPKDFYEAIPFWSGTRVVDESFKELTDNLQDPESAMQLLEKSTLPFCKSVKRLFAKRSGLFFYLKECEFLYGLFNDVNLFCTHLNKRFIFDFLSTMHYHEYPLKTFLTDFSTVLDKKRFTERFSISQALISYAMSYTSLSDYVRKKEQGKWIENIDVFEKCYFRIYIENEISISLPLMPQSMKDCVIDKYRFKYLRTKQECVIAGEKMKNCLVNWDSYSNPAVIIYKGDKIVAAVEFLNGVLVQAKQCRNKSIEPDSDLCRAIEKWCKINNIKFDPEKLDDLPF
ncbi:MAG: hypothetical protein UGF89_06855 [Acutalibacteraceae bacterium]|nr:hypothetical protein [Acutalibacteraceae bacterium]